ncbi:hypothetical protein F5Y15DRAFT_1437 [Xylariaceae sp. FL0016]|nr:hypothetical protein F5Y15DRAFT_1437 [Xylariaceae sp. FL0016]
MVLSSLFISLALAASAAATPVLRPTPTIKGVKAEGAKYFFVFGDSYTSTGFSIDGAKPDAGNPIGNPALPGKTNAGGLTWAGFLTTEMNNSLILTYDFAVSGATVDNSIVAATLAPNIPSMSDQVTTWTKNVQPKPSYAPWTAEDSLFAFYFGVNDVGNTFSGSNAQAKIQKDLDRYFTLLGNVYESGGRNFLLMNVPPTQKTPIMKMLGNANLVSLIEYWNKELPTRTDAFKTAHSGAVVTIVDTTSPFDEVINNPTKYGAPNSNCQNTNGKSCIWYDFYHPGQAIQKLMAQAVVTTLKSDWFKVPSS